jgi:hypothetical protein
MLSTDRLNDIIAVLWYPRWIAPERLPEAC